jgi:hypothetical protein
MRVQSNSGDEHRYRRTGRLSLFATKHLNKLKSIYVLLGNKMQIVFCAKIYTVADEIQFWLLTVIALLTHVRKIRGGRKEKVVEALNSQRCSNRLL